MLLFCFTALTFNLSLPHSRDPQAGQNFKLPQLRATNILDTALLHFGQPPSTLCLEGLGGIFRFHTFLAFHFQLPRSGLPPFWTPLTLILDIPCAEPFSGVALSLCERCSDPPSGTDGSTTRPFWTPGSLILDSH